MVFSKSQVSSVTSGCRKSASFEAAHKLFSGFAMTQPRPAERRSDGDDDHRFVFAGAKTCTQYSLLITSLFFAAKIHNHLTTLAVIDSAHTTNCKGLPYPTFRIRIFYFFYCNAIY